MVYRLDLKDQSCIIIMKFLVVASALVAAISAEADPALLYAGYAGYAGLPLAYGVGLKSAPCVNAANVPVPCAAGYGLVHYGKRDADAEADPALLYGAYAAAVPFGSSTGLDPLTQGLDASTQGYAPFGYAAYPYAAYAGYPYAAAYGAYPHGVAATYAGLVHSSHVGLCVNYLGASVPYGKREAEAEADPALLYAGYA